MFCAMIDSLAFLSLNKVKYGMDFIKQNVPNNETHDRRIRNKTQVNQMLMWYSGALE